MVLTATDRDPEQEAEDKVDEEKLPGVDEEGTAAIESGFPTTGAPDWEAAPAAGFTTAPAGGAQWDGAAPPAGEEWGAAPAPATTEWANEPAKETQW